MSEEKLVNAAYEVRTQIKVAMLNNRISQQELAKELGVAESELSDAVNGSMRPKLVEIRHRIYERFNIK